MLIYFCWFLCFVPVTSVVLPKCLDVLTTPNLTMLIARRVHQPAWQSVMLNLTSLFGTASLVIVAPINHCGADAPGWLNGQHPSKVDGVVKRKVCFHWSSNPCLWSTNITVMNCGLFYVYKFTKRPECALRFCGNRGFSKLKILFYYPYFEYGVLIARFKCTQV